MERKGGRIFLVNHSMLELDAEWETAREYGYVFRKYSQISDKELRGFDDWMESNAILIRAKLERILKCDYDHYQ